MSEIKNATITATKLGNDDHGMSFWLQLDYGGSGQGFGGYALGGKYTDFVITGILNALDVETWEKLVGTPVRADCDQGKVHRIGHYLKDTWFDPAEFEA